MSFWGAGLSLIVGGDTREEASREVGNAPTDIRLRSIDACEQIQLVVIARSVDRPPLPFESSMPGVFAVGDVRHGAVKRVATEVGEGSVAIGSVHQYLAEYQVPAAWLHRH